MTGTRISDMVRGVLALVALVGLLVGVPYGLITQVGSPLPTALPSWAQISQTLTRGDLDPWTIIKVMAVLVWLAWAQLTASVVVETIPLIRYRRVTRAPSAAPLRATAANLVGSVALLFTTLARGIEPAAALDVPLELAIATVPVLPDDDPAVTAPPPSDLDGRRPVAAVAPDRDDRPVWNVQRRDTLWDIAEQTLGDGLRWREIHHLNVGRPQPGGDALQPDGDSIREGWTLVLPDGANVASGDTRAPARDPESDGAVQGAITVSPGDTLWDLSGSYLDDPYAWPELYRANEGRLQPDGRRLTDPDLIHPGWELDLPAGHDGQRTSSDVSSEPVRSVPPPEDDPAPLDLAGSAPEQPEVDVPDEPTASEPTTPATTAPLDALESAEDAVGSAEDVAAMTERIDDPDDAWIERAAAISGVGLMAAGIAATLDRLRRARLRRRLPGRRIKLPDGALADTERRLRGLADPEAAKDVDTALRLIALAQAERERPMPAVVLVSVSPVDIAVHLAKPHADPPEGWKRQDEGLTWVLPRTPQLNEQRAHAEQALAPVPLLVTLGSSAEGQRRVLLNLGHAQTVSLDADLELRRTILLQQALELATTAHVTALDVIVHGFGGALSTLERVTFAETADDALEALERAAAWAEQAEQPQIDTALGLFLDPLPPEQLERLRALTSRSRGAVAVIVSDWADVAWHLRADADGTVLLPANVRLQPLELTDEELEQVAELILQAKTAPYTDPDPDHEPELTEPLADEAVIDLTEPDETSESDEAAEDRSDTDETADRTTEPPAVDVRVLGPVEVEGAGDFVSNKAQELVVYLATHRHGEDTDTLLTALWPNTQPPPSRLHSEASRARRALGEDAEGEPYLPRASKGRYLLSRQVGLDLETFRAHLTRARSSPDSAIDELETALDLVRGRPFSSTPIEYAWASFDVYSIAQEVTDAAHWLAELALEDGRLDLAAWAAEQGLRVEPHCEPLYRDLMRAAAQAGDMPAVWATMDRLRRLADDNGDANDADDRLDPTTLALYRQLTGGSNRPSIKDRTQSSVPRS